MAKGKKSIGAGKSKHWVTGKRVKNKNRSLLSRIKGLCEAAQVAIMKACPIGRFRETGKREK